ncbi:MAG: DUF4433 domain-containing protein [Acidobacteriia bacterium]|nr:DUF4433 domain-containing protein [Terriglobia bacterium]
MTWASEAMPQTVEEAQSGPSFPEVIEAARERGIDRIVHFTTISGLKGILASSAVKARAYLPEDARLKHVYEPNAADRSRDARWLGYVNLSVSSINMHMFRFSEREHPGRQWAILEFGPEILGDPGVVFCTTNNIYPAARRGIGRQGFEQMFAPKVYGRYSAEHDRRNRAVCETTDPQAEVLYPFELPLQDLRGIAVREEETLDAVVGLRAVFLNCPYVERKPEAFQ